MTAVPASNLRFGRFTLRPSTRELLDGAAPLKLGARAFDLLMTLVQARGEVVSRETLFERAWPGLVVLDDNLKVQIMALRRLLGADAIVTVPARGYRFALPLHDESASVPAASAEPGFFGRDEDLATVRRALTEGRLVTLVGSGGIGKTRLARVVARRTSIEHALVELAPLQDAQALPAMVAQALALPAVPGEEALAAAIAPLHVLVVLDNAEHLLAAVASLARLLLDSAPRLLLLVTSQEPLGLSDEQVVRLQGLACPASDRAGDGGAIAGPDVLASPAVAMLVARAKALGALPALDGEHNRERLAAAEICRRLDGVPLALELAAARVPLLGFTGVLERLREPLALLTRGPRDAPPRQQTLRATLQWSHGLLGAPGHALFRRLAVFADSFDLAGAERLLRHAALHGGGDAPAALETADGLQDLVDKSLLSVLPGNEAPRFRLLEAARAFARERLVESGEAPVLDRAHAQAVLEQFLAADRHADTEPALEWLQALLPELANLRAALRWARGPQGDEVLAIALAGAAGSFWTLAGLDRDAQVALRALAPAVHDPLPRELQLRFWLAVALRHADYQFTWAETLEAVQRAVALARELGAVHLLLRAMHARLLLAQRARQPVDGQAEAAAMRALEAPHWTTAERRLRRQCEHWALFQREDWPAFAAALRAELRLQSEAGDSIRAWTTAHRLALAEMACARPDAAVAVMRQAVDEIRAEGLMRRCWQQVAILAMAHIENGAAPAAPVQEAVRLMQGAGALMWMVCHLAEWLAQQQRFDDAARLLGWAERRYAERDEEPSGHGQRARARALAAIEAANSAAQRAAWQAEGERWADDDVARVLLR
jgi:predicted ATPase/DNA-binding winged helix-turn-helix (wHTH) protein